jgi:hypothetical protein
MAVMGTAAADELAFAVDVGDGVPFTAAELEAAVALRLGEDAAALPVRVIGAGRSGEVVVIVGESRRAVVLGDAVGEAAARRVALVSLDLFREVSARSDPEPGPGPVPGPDPVSVSGSAPSPERRGGLGWGSVSVSAIGTIGDGDGGGVRAAGRVAVGAIDIVGAIGVAVSTGDAGTRVTTVPVRLGVGKRWRLGGVVWGIDVGGVTAPYRIRTDDGDARYRDGRTRLGGTGSISVAVPVWRSLWLGADAGVDVFGATQRYLVGTEERYANRRVEPYGGAGIGVSF